MYRIQADMYQESDAMAANLSLTGIPVHIQIGTPIFRYKSAGMLFRTMDRRECIFFSIFANLIPNKKGCYHTLLSRSQQSAKTENIIKLIFVLT
ncbi:hypothetical protein HYC85_018843 [Camellia sinensis]|uniref:Uncharacterized protein n=1 Tax=Camellia sinensis TaxID=4442 RepID=A0A7J7GZ70_CAMSI|nr:hypothetical protein HYC85_018843 [Camellia sinensis]